MEAILLSRCVCVSGARLQVPGVWEGRLWDFPAFQEKESSQGGGLTNHSAHEPSSPQSERKKSHRRGELQPPVRPSPALPSSNRDGKSDESLRPA